MHRFLSFAPFGVLAALFAGCATSPPVAMPSVPASLQAPPGSHLYLEALASGVQIYECSMRPDSAFEWAFKAPEATLSDRAGHPLGKHYAGPTWEANDGSAVSGEIKARDPGPTATAIPWLLLGAKSHLGAGTFCRCDVRPTHCHCRRRCAGGRLRCVDTQATGTCAVLSRLHLLPLAALSNWAKGRGPPIAPATPDHSRQSPSAQPSSARPA